MPLRQNESACDDSARLPSRLQKYKLFCNQQINRPFIAHFVTEAFLISEMTNRCFYGIYVVIHCLPFRFSYQHEGETCNQDSSCQIQYSLWATPGGCITAAPRLTRVIYLYEIIKLRILLTAYLNMFCLMSCCMSAGVSFILQQSTI
jgi:hypothetical protein